MISKIIDWFKCTFSGHLWMCGYTNNPNGTTKIDDPRTWYGPVERRCQRCLKRETRW